MAVWKLYEAVVGVAMMAGWPADIIWSRATKVIAKGGEGLQVQVIYCT